MRIVNADSFQYKHMSNTSNTGGNNSFEYIQKEDVLMAPVLNAIPVVYCKECYLHNQCYIEDAFKKLGYTDGYCRMGDKEF